MKTTYYTFVKEEIGKEIIKHLENTSYVSYCKFDLGSAIDFGARVFSSFEDAENQLYQQELFKPGLYAIIQFEVLDMDLFMSVFSSTVRTDDVYTKELLVGVKAAAFVRKPD